MTSTPLPPFPPFRPAPYPPFSLSALQPLSSYICVCLRLRVCSRVQNLLTSFAPAPPRGNRPASLGGKTVLIVGFSNSAVDTATTLAGHAKHVYIARRHDAFVVSISPKPPSPPYPWLFLDLPPSG